MSAIRVIPENATPQAVIPINEIVLHTFGDADAFVGAYLVKRNGELHFPGAANATVRFVDQGANLGNATYDRMKILPIDTGYGRFDHHLPKGRIKDSSSVKLVSEYLGVSSPAMLCIAEEIHWGDNNRGVPDTKFGGLIKAINRNMPCAGNVIMNWLYPALDILERQLAMNYSAVANELGALEYLRGLMADERHNAHYRTPEIQKRLVELFTESNKRALDPSIEDSRGQTFFTEIDFVVRALQRCGKPNDEIFKWISLPINALALDQALFNRALGEMATASNHWAIDARSRDGDLQIAASLVRTDNLAILRAANSSRMKNLCRRDIIAVYNTRGNVMIALNNRSLTLDTVVAMIRWTDADEDTRDKLDWNDLMKDGEHSAAPNWHYERDRGQLFCGSPTHPGVKPTRIAPQGVIDAMTYGFHPALIDKWQTRRGIPTKSQQDVAKLLPVA